MKASSNEYKVKWVGKKLPKVPIEWLSDREVLFYKSCFYGPLSIALGDYVLIQNSDAPEPDTIDGCEIARVEHLYECVDDLDEIHPYRVVVKWYSRFSRIPAKALRTITTKIDMQREVVEDMRPYDRDVAIGCIFKKCEMVFASHDDYIDELLASKAPSSSRRRPPVFVCRFRYAKVGRAFRVLPLELSGLSEGIIPDSNSVRSRKSSLRGSLDTVLALSPVPTTPKAKSTSQLKQESNNENKVSPIKIVGNRVVRLSRTKTNAAGSPLAQQNSKAIETPKKPRLSAARRNLNDSFGSVELATTEQKLETVATPTSAQKTRRNRVSRYSSLSEDQVFIEINELQLTPSRRGRKRSNSTEFADIYKTPKKQPVTVALTDLEPEPKNTPSLRRRSLLNSATKRLENTPTHAGKQLDIIPELAAVSTPKRSRRLTLNSNANGKDPDYIEPSIRTPKTQRTPSSKPSSAKRNETPLTPIQKLRLMRAGELSPSLQQRTPSSMRARKTELQLAREVLHVSAVPESLPCREEEFTNIYAFVERKLQDQCGGCMYISGVPGTGKTATVTAVVRKLKQQADEDNDELPDFDYMEINGMRLTEPRQAYVQIYKQLTGKTVTWQHAHALLEQRFTTKAPRRNTTVLLVDELDILCNRRQDVVYNLLDWPTKATARLVVITIANTMDLPERLLKGKVTSRLGLTRLTFKPYTHKQLQVIVQARLAKFEAFKAEAVQLVSRKVAAVSGDARRALDICRRATELAEVVGGDGCVALVHVQQALNEMIASPKVQAIRNCSRQEQYFLQAVAAEVSRTGVDEVRFLGVYAQLESICAFDGTRAPATTQALHICAKLGAERLIISEHSRNDIFQRLLLNVSADDIHYALRISNV